MVGWFFAILAGMAGLLTQAEQSPTNPELLPSVSISLPPDVLSETVQISYFLIGPFGGYGGYVKQQADMQSYEIPALVEGKAATEIRMIVYAAGCEIQQFVIPLAEHSRVNQEFLCQRVQTVKLSGEIVPSELVRDNNAELVVTYMAYWAHGFYGIADGIVTRFHLATVSPDADGVFQVDLPYFSTDAEASSSQRRAGFRLVLRDSKTWNLIAFNLEPDTPELRLETHDLRIRSHYPDGLKFTPTPPSLSVVGKRKGQISFGFRKDCPDAISDDLQTQLSFRATCHL